MIELFTKQPLLIGIAVFFIAALVLSEFLKPKRRARNWRNYSSRKNGLQSVGGTSPETPDAAKQLSRVMAADFKKQKLLNKSEFRLFAAIEREIAVAGLDWRLMAQVNLGEILYTNDKPAYWAINSKRVDFLLIDNAGTPLHAIEYQGSGHHQGNAAARDAVKKEALRKAGIGYYEVASGDLPEDLRAIITKLKRNA
jgi:Protein of unknown function (DUF2726)